MASLISAVSWIPKQAAAAKPVKYELTAGELKRVEYLAKVKLDDARIELDAARELQSNLDGTNIEGEDGLEWEDSHVESNEIDAEMQEAEAIVQAKAAANRIKSSNVADPSDLSIYRLDDYDKEESKGSAMGAFSNIKGLQYYQDNHEDPYITLKETNEEQDEEAELEIYPTDSLLVAARTQDDVSQLDVYVYDDSAANLYIHHDLLLPAMPLALEWLSFSPASSMEATTSKAGKKGNYVAVATMDPEIEIWNLDVLDGLYPDAILGPPRGSTSTSLEALTSTFTATSIEQDSIGNASKKKKKKLKKVKPGKSDKYHTDSVLSLSWNKTHQSLLASSSADSTIKLWDLSTLTGEAIRSYSHHSNKVSAVQWNNKSPTVLLSGAWGGQLKVFDTRTQDVVLSYDLTPSEGDVECLQWNEWKESEFLIGTESGSVQLFDSRMLSSSQSPHNAADQKPRLWTLDAHTKSVSCLDYNTLVEGFLVTGGGVDNLVKLWSVTTEGTMQISLITSKDLGVGNVFSTTFCPDDPSTIAIAGSKSSLQIWDTASNAGIRRAYGERMKNLGKDLDACIGKGNGGLIGLEGGSDGELTDEE